MMSNSDPQQPCPKCGQLQAQSQMFSHWSSCKGQPVSVPSPYPQQQLTPMQWPQPQQLHHYPLANEMANYEINKYYQNHPQEYQQKYGHRLQPQYQAPPVHRHSWIENDSYKWCIECRALNLKLRGTWFLFVRYGLKFIWIIFLLDLVLALGLVSYFHINR